MSAYTFRCTACDLLWDEERTVATRNDPLACPACDAAMKRDMIAEGPKQVGRIDGPTVGHYGSAFPSAGDGTTRTVVPNASAFREYCKRKNLENVA